MALGDVYEKQAGAWVKTANIGGPPGKDGEAWYNGVGAPAAGLGEPGDMYLDTTGAAAPANPPPRVTTLPGSAVDGQEVYYAPDVSAIGGPSVLWHLRYRTAIAGAHKWEYLGGAGLHRLATGRISTASNGAPVELAGSGLDITLPLGGWYEAEMEADSFSNAVQFVYMEWQCPAGAYTYGYSGAWRLSNTNVLATKHGTGRRRFMAAAPAGARLTTRYCGYGGNDAVFDGRSITVHPVLVG